jgi:hypothetical protein
MRKKVHLRINTGNEARELLRVELEEGHKIQVKLIWGYIFNHVSPTIFKFQGGRRLKT